MAKNASKEVTYKETYVSQRKQKETAYTGELYFIAFIKPFI